MKRTRFLTRAAVVASSMLLAGGFVAYRAGAFDSVAKPEAVEAPVQKAPELMSSSKYDVILNPVKLPPTPSSWIESSSASSTSSPPGDSKPLQLMSSSKSIVIAPAISKTSTGPGPTPPK